MLMSADLATPLHAGYGERFGFSDTVPALIFATYAVVLVPSLLVFGQVSDRFGDRGRPRCGDGGSRLFAAAPRSLGYSPLAPCSDWPRGW
jgi:MFS family permease